MVERQPRAALVHAPVDAATRRKRHINTSGSSCSAVVGVAVVIIRVRKPRKVIRQTARRARDALVLRRRRLQGWRGLFVLERGWVERRLPQQMHRALHLLLANRPAQMRLLRTGELRRGNVFRTAVGGACAVERINRRHEGGWGAATNGCARTPAFRHRGQSLAAFGRRVGRQGGVCLSCAAGEDVERRVDGDFKVPSFRRIVLVRSRQTHDNLLFAC